MIHEQKCAGTNVWHSLFYHIVSEIKKNWHLFSHVCILLYINTYSYQATNLLDFGETCKSSLHQKAIVGSDTLMILHMFQNFQLWNMVLNTILVSHVLFATARNFLKSWDTSNFALNTLADPARAKSKIFQSTPKFRKYDNYVSYPD